MTFREVIHFLLIGDGFPALKIKRLGAKQDEKQQFLGGRDSGGD